MKSYLVLSVVALILFILATSAMTVAVYLLVRETYKTAVIVYDQLVEGAIAIRDWYEFTRMAGAF